MVFSADGALLASASNDGTVVVWDTKAWKPIATIGDLQGGASAVAFVPGARGGAIQLAISDYKGFVHICDLAGTELARVPAGSSIPYMEASPDHAALLVGGQDGAVLLMDPQSSLQLGAVTVATETRTSSVDITADRAMALVGMPTHQLEQWDLATGRRTAASHLLEHPLAGVGSLRGVLDASGRWAVAVDYQGADAALIETATGRQVALVGHRKGLLDGAFTPDGSQAFTGGLDADVRSWAVPSGKPLVTYTGATSTVHYLAVSPDGTLLASSAEDRKVRIYRIGEPAPIFEYTGHPDDLGAIAFSPDGKEIISAGGNEAHVWDVRTGALRLRLAEHDGSVRTVAASNDGARFYTASDDGNLRVWDATTGALLRKIHVPREVPAQAVHYLRDGAGFYTAGASGIVRMWAELETTASVDAIRGWIACRVPYRVEDGRLVARPARVDCGAFPLR